MLILLTTEVRLYKYSTKCSVIYEFFQAKWWGKVLSKVLMTAIANPSRWSSPGLKQYPHTQAQISTLLINEGGPLQILSFLSAKQSLLWNSVLGLFAVHELSGV